ncbi:MAG: aryl-sulfate sulfotransferase, partial [Candidatus Methylomirabilis sp.]|nr:aryl-sulfate sulfotransferase [Deltaproteobacteria bacterium]
VKEYSTLDFLDPLRVDPTRGATAKTDFLSNGFNGYYGTTTRDWTHGNGVVNDAARNDYVVSLRHQDIVVAIDRDTGALEWVLGADDPATAGDDDWPFLALAGGSLPFHTHDPTILPNGDLMVYDNGVIRPDAFFARPARFALDLSEEGRTATQTWDFVDKDYNAGGGPVSIIIGSARLQAGGGSVLVSNGAFSPCGNPPGPCAAQWYGNIVEVAHAIPRGEAQEKLFEINVGRTYGAQVLTYRAERYPSLYVNIPRDRVCGTVPLSTGPAGQAAELQNVVDGLSAATVGSVGACLARLADGS